MIIIDEGAKADMEAALAFQAQIQDKLAAHLTLDRALGYLGDFKLHGEKECVTLVYHDFAPYSFGFTLYTPGDVADPSTLQPYQYPASDHPELVGHRRFMVGGIIYHGPGCPGDGSAPSFNVSLQSGSGWSIHT